MAVTAKFVADFSNFQDAVQKAEVTLKGFETDANKVGKALNRMVDNFSGRKLIQDANLMAEAVDRIGGPSRLTTAELKRVSAQAVEAAAKLRALGETVPPKIQALADKAGLLQKVMGNLSPAVAGVLGALGGFSATAIVQGIQRQVAAALDYADALSNLSARTGVSAEGLQRLESIGKLSGVSMETLARSVKLLNQNLDSPQAVKALREMGLNYAEIRKLEPEKQFLEIAKGIARIKDPVERANAGVALFGRGWDEVAAAFGKNVDEIVRNTHVMSDEQVKALDEAGDAWDSFTTNTGRKVKGFFGDLILGWQRYKEEQDKSLAALQAVPGQIPDLPAPPKRAPIGDGAAVNDVIDPTMITQLKVSGKTLDEQRVATDKAAKSLEKYREITQSLKDALVPLTLNQMKMVLAWREGGASVGDMAVALNISQVAIQRYFESLDRMNKSVKEVSISTGTLAQVLRTEASAGIRQLDADIVNVTSDLEKWKAVQGGELFPELPQGSLDAWKGLQNGIKETLPLMVKLKAVAKDSIGGLNDIFQAAFEGGGGVLGAIQSFATNGLKSLLAMIPGVGAFVSQFAGAIVAGFKKLGSAIFGGTAGRDEVRKFVTSTFGDFDKLHKKLESMGAEGERLWVVLTQGVGRNDKEGAARAIAEVSQALEAHEQTILSVEQELLTLNERYADIQIRMGELVTISPELKAALDAAINSENPEAYKLALDDINAAIEEQEAKARFLEQTMAKYGLTWKDLGEEARKGHVSKEAGSIEKEFRALLEAGVDVNNIMRHMGKGINEFVKDAKKTGTEIPESFRDVIQTAIDAGEVFDESGKKITGMEELGLKFGVTVEEAMKGAAASMATAIEKMVKLIEEKLVPAIKGIPDANVRINYTSSGDAPDVHPMAAGGMGRVSKPTLFLAGEAGPEEFAFSGANKKFGSAGSVGSGGGGSVQQTIVVNLDGREIAWALVPHLPDAQAALA